MAPSHYSRITLLIDQAKISIEERNRLLLFGSSPNSEEDEELIDSLRHILAEINSFEHKVKTAYDGSNLRTLVSGYRGLLQQMEKDENLNTTGLEYTEAGTDKPLPQLPGGAAAAGYEDEEDAMPKLSKSVRFKDKLVDEPPVSPSLEYREPYRDDPETSTMDMYQQNQELITGQDERLDRLSHSVGRQHELSIQIDDELQTHLGLLDDVDQITDRSQNRLDQAKRRLEKFSRKAAQNGSCMTIAILLLIFIILVLVLK